MSDPRDVLTAKFEAAHRFANFGNVLERIQISGFRVHTNTVLDIRSPVTAICGLNGTGKSTILQIAAAAYKNTVGPHYYLAKFFVVSHLDPTPYTNVASVTYAYCEPHQIPGRPGQLTIARNAGTRRKGWTGYKRRRERGVFYGGVGMFIPKVEKRDFVVYGAARLVIDGHNQVPPTVKEWTSKILGRSYDEMHAVTAHAGTKSGRVLRFNRRTISYSEAHMGFGEGRAAYLVEILERIPEKSLILLEEPETSLHASAQHQIGQYFMDVSIRRGHQIILTTHSEYLLRSLPSASCVYLDTTAGDLKVIPGLRASYATSLMSEGHDRSLTILVEDDCARALLTEKIRQTDPDWLKAIRIHSGDGLDCTTIKATMKCLKDTGLAVAAVRDGDQTEHPSEGLFVLPGGGPPEKVMLQLSQVKTYLETTYHFRWDDFATREGLASINHHEWIPKLGNALTVDVEVLTNEIARQAASVLDFGNLITLLKETVRQ